VRQAENAADAAGAFDDIFDGLGDLVGRADQRGPVLGLRLEPAGAAEQAAAGRGRVFRVTGIGAQRVAVGHLGQRLFARVRDVDRHHHLPVLARNGLAVLLGGLLDPAQVRSNALLSTPATDSRPQPLRPADVGPDGVNDVATETGRCGSVKLFSCRRASFSSNQSVFTETSSLRGRAA